MKTLHIRPEPVAGTAAHRMERLLAAASVRVESCSDVYRGLARLGDSRSEAFRAVIVCMDSLGEPELEFFSLVSRVRRDAEVYVYGGERSTSGVRRAIELGATGQATEDVIRGLGKATTAPVPDEAAGETPIEGPSHAEPAADVGPPVASQTKPIAAMPVAEPVGLNPSERRTIGSDQLDDEEGLADDGTISGPVRVPWLRYDDGPTRAAPQHRKPATSDSGVRPTPPSRSRPHEPLVTEEELRALLGDEVAGIAPDENGPGEFDEHDDGESSP